MTGLSPLLSPDTPRSAKSAPLSSANPISLVLLLRHHDGNRLFRGPAPAVGPDNHDGMRTRLKRLGKMPEGSVGRDTRHRLAVHDERCAGFRVAVNFRHPAV